MDFVELTQEIVVPHVTIPVKCYITACTTNILVRWCQYKQKDIFKLLLTNNNFVLCKFLRWVIHT